MNVPFRALGQDLKKTVVTGEEKFRGLTKKQRQAVLDNPDTPEKIRKAAEESE